MTFGLTKTHYYMATQRELNEVVKPYYKDKLEEEAIMSKRLQYMQSLNKSFRVIMRNPTEEIVETQVSLLTSEYKNDEQTHIGMMRATYRYWRNIMTLEDLQDLDIFPHIYKKCEELDAPIRHFPEDGSILKVRFLNADGSELGADGSEAKSRGLDDVSFTITNDNIEQVIRGLYLRLKQDRCISDDTKFNVFSDAFSGKPLNEITERIQWIRSKSLCVYFICQLLNKDISGLPREDKIKHSIETEEYHYWKKFEHLFCDKNGKPMLYGDRVKEKMTNQPKDYTIIDSILLKPF